jgi:SAM-dependent methyltransferase
MKPGPPQIFDRHALTLHRERARKIGGEPFLLREAADALVERLRAVQRTFSDGVLLEANGPALAALKLLATRWTYDVLRESETLLVAQNSVDLIVSALSLHSLNDLPGVLIQARRSLRPDGLFVAALLGGETLTELRDSVAAAEITTLGGVSPRVSPFGDVRELGALLQRAGFALPVADVERTVVRYRDFSTLVSDLRAMGETNALAERSRKPMSRATAAATVAHYGAHHAEVDGRLRATFDIVYLTGWAPHESQQQPLKPGSARSRLAEAVKTTEHSAGPPVAKN